ncbi:hypothetical protein [Pseudomonas asplenii]|uniref:hypothetical protein n=1 Tax=Pseudomonas asplenii TaxID=53407 RepID=UPI0006B5528D|nr:hypothetical protein [Pseudomonas fuscovaginae]KPA94040.1 hypothetical protein PF70_06003 [Pseudomonas fuscovaginae]
MEMKTLLHELLAAFGADLKGTEKQLKQSIADVGSEFRGTLKRVQTSLGDNNSGLRTLLERQSEQIAALNLSIDDRFNELRSFREKTVDGLSDNAGAKDHEPLAQGEEPKEVIHERDVRLEAAIRRLDSKNRLIQWHLGIISVGVAFPFVRGAFEQILALCQH